ARLQTIPPELYEAAKVDGAGTWRRLRHITLPQTRNVLFVIVLLRSIFMFTKFDTVWLMAGEGGVSRYVRTLPVYAYARIVTYFTNSVVVSLATVALTLSVSSMGAYGLTRFTFAGRERVAGLILVTYMFAPIMIIIPFYILVKQLGIVNTRLALVLSYTTF